jgi:hypothetical protein
MRRLLLLISLPVLAAGADLSVTVRPLTHGPLHHFFGYIGQVRTIPWNATGRYIVALQTGFQNRMPTPADAADIVLIDTRHDDAITVVEHTLAWNPQQGTMLYWNPEQAETQFFFNDRDPATNEIFCVLYDTARRRRIAEFRYPDASFGNSGVAQHGGRFLGINYGRLARLRPVTGYPGAHDRTAGVAQPADDGIFIVDVATKDKRLLVSFKQLADNLRATHPEVDGKELFINHTLWNRDDDRIYFFVRGDFEKREDSKCNIPCVIHPDGSGLRALSQFIGGHPDWENGHRMIGAQGDDQILFDTDAQRSAGTLGNSRIFPKPSGDVALSPDGAWFVNGHGEKGKNHYTILHRSDGAWVRTAGFDQGDFTKGDLRLDPGPLWNRTSTQLLVPGIADDAAKTRQLFVITIHSPKGSSSNHNP